MRKKIKILDFMCLLIVALVTVLGLSALMLLGAAERSKISKRSELAQGIQEDITQVYRSLNAVNRILIENESWVQKLERQGPTESRMGAFLEKMYTLAGRRNVYVSDVNPQVSLQEAFYAKVPIQLTCRGSFADMHGLLFDLEHVDSLVRIRQVLISRPAGADQCKMQMDCHLYEL